MCKVCFACTQNELCFRRCIFDLRCGVFKHSIQQHPAASSSIQQHPAASSSIQQHPAASSSIQQHPAASSIPQSPRKKHHNCHNSSESSGRFKMEGPFAFLVIRECVARVPVSFGGVGVRLCSPKVVSAFATVRNRPQPFACPPQPSACPP